MDQRTAKSAIRSRPAGRRGNISKRSDGRPLYEQVDNIIRQRLLDNVWKPGEALPSEMQLARELNVSQGTVRKALGDLVAENLLYRRQGLGTFVSEHTDRRALFLYFNLVGDDGERQLPESQVISRALGAASAIESERLGLAPGAGVYRFTRIRSFKGTPTIVETVALPADLFPGLDAGSEPPNHLYRFYQSEYGITVVKAAEQVRAVAATAGEADSLGIAPGAPLLEIDRTSLMLDSRPVEWRLSRCRTDHCRYVAERG